MKFVASVILEAIDKVTAPMKSIESAVSNLQNKMATANKDLKSGLEMQANLALVGQAADQVGDLFEQLNKDIIGNASQMEGYSATLKNMFNGNVAMAQKRLKELANFAANTPFNMPDVVQLGLNLQNVGKYSKQMMTDLGDLAAASGKPIEQVSGAFAKLASGSKGEAVNMFRDLLISTTDWQKATGKGISKNGELLASTEEMIAAIPKLLQMKNFSGLMEEKSKSYAGVMSNFEDSTDQLKATIGLSLLPALSSGVKSLTAMIEPIRKLLQENPKLARVIGFVILGLGALAVVISPIIMMIATIGAISGLTSAGLAVLSGTFGLVGASVRAVGLALMSNPILLIIGLVAMAAVLIIANWSKVGPFFTGLWSGIVNIFTKAWDFIWNILLNNKFIQAALIAFLPFIGIPLAIIKNWESISGFFSNLWNGIVMVFNKAVAAITNIIPQWMKDFFTGKKKEITVNGPTGANLQTGSQISKQFYSSQKVERSEVRVRFDNAPTGTKIQAGKNNKNLNLSMGYAGVGY